LPEKSVKNSAEKPVEKSDHDKDLINMTNPEQSLAKSDSGFSEKANIELEGWKKVHPKYMKSAPEKVNK